MDSNQQFLLMSYQHLECVNFISRLFINDVTATSNINRLQCEIVMPEL